jgi:hypothetical protein
LHCNIPERKRADRAPDLCRLVHESPAVDELVRNWHTDVAMQDLTPRRREGQAPQPPEDG